MTPQRRLRVLHVIEAMVQGGAESVVVEHARCAGPDVEILVCALNREGPALELAAAAGARIVRIESARGLLRPVSRLLRLAAMMRDERVDVVNGHNPTGGLYATLAARLAGVPVIVRTEHSLHYSRRHSIVYPMLEQLLTWLTRRVVCVCQAVLESHVRRLPWAARRFVIVANGISPAPHTHPRREVRAELGIGETAFVALTVGSLTRQKAQHVMLDAFARLHASHPDARLVVAGDGPLRAALTAQAGVLGLTQVVTFTGPRNDVADLVEACDVFLLSSVREGLPITLLEAMRGGRAAVVTRVGGMPEAAEDGVTAYVVPEENAIAIAEALGRLASEPAACAAMGAAGQRRWAALYRADRMVATTEALYREIAGSAQRTVAARGTKAGHAAP